MFANRLRFIDRNHFAGFTLDAANDIIGELVGVLIKPEELKKLRDEFEEYSKKNPYKPFLPSDAQPSLNLNKELMEKWRPLMEKSYLKFDATDLEFH